MTRITVTGFVFFLVSGLSAAHCAEDAGRHSLSFPAGAMTGYMQFADRLGEEAPPPVEHIVTSADYAFILSDDGAKCLARFELVIFPTGKYLRVPLLKDEIALESVTVDGTACDLTPIDGWLCFLPDQPGAYVLEAAFSLKPHIAMGIRLISMVTPVSAVNRASFSSDREWLLSSDRLPHPCEVYPEPPELVERRRACPEPSRRAGTIEKQVAVFPGGQLDLRWEDIPPVAGRSPLFAVAPDVFYLFEGQDLYVSARLVTTVHAAPASGVHLAIPHNAKNVQVRGPAVRRFVWEGADAVVDFKGNFEGRTAISVSFIHPIGDGQTLASLPIPSVKGARISGGTVAVSCPSDSDLAVENVSRAEEIPAYEIPDSLKALMRAQPILAFRITGDSPVISVRPVSLGAAAVVEALADRADFASFRGPGGDEIVKASLSIRNERRQFLRIGLPERARVIRCTVSGREVPPGQAGSIGEMIIPLERSIETLEGIVSFPVEFIYFRKSSPFAESGAARLELPVMDIPVARATWTAYTPEGIRLKDVSGNMNPVREFEEAARMMEYGRGYVLKEKLVENYWLDANDAYKRQDYEEAQRNLDIILKNYPGSDLAKDAQQLRSNVDLALRPPEKLTRSFKSGVSIAKTFKIQKSIERQMEAKQFGQKIEQQEFITKAEEAGRKGEMRKSIALMEKAQKKSEEMAQAGAAYGEQKAIMTELSGKLESQKKRFEKGGELLREKKRLQAKLKELEEGLVVEEKYQQVLDDKGIRRLEETQKGSGVYVAKPVSGPEAGFIEDSPAAELEQQVKELEARVKSVGELQAGYSYKASDAKQRDAAEIADREVERSIEAARPLVSLGRAEEAARQVETVYSHYKDKLGEDGAHLLADAARKAEEFVVSARGRGQRVPLLGDVDEDVVLKVEESVGDALREGDEELTEHEREQFLQTVSRNVRYRTGGGPAVREPVSAPAPDQPAAVEFRGRQAGEALELLEEVKRHGGKAVNVTIGSNSLITPSDISAVGGTVNSYDGGYYAVLDRAQIYTLNEIRPPVASETSPVRLDNFFVGNAAVLANDERVRFSGSSAEANAIVLQNKEIALNPNQFLLVANEKGTSILGAGRATDWREARPAEKAAEKGFTLDIPRVGKAHLFEKLLMRAGEKPEITMKYEG